MSASELPALHAAGDGAVGSRSLVMVVGNEMPFETRAGENVPALLDDYLDAGGALLLLGPRFPPMDPQADHRDPAQMGGSAGMFWWKVWRDGRWVDYDPFDGTVVGVPSRRGTTYWGEGPMFGAWEHRHGLFGFETPCRGVFDVEGRIIDSSQPIQVVYTDWAVRRPWRFHPLAFTERTEPLVTGPRAERYPCAALLVNQATGGRIAVVAPTLCARVDLLHRVLPHVASAAREVVPG